MLVEASSFHGTRPSPHRCLDQRVVLLATTPSPPPPPPPPAAAAAAALLLLLLLLLLHLLRLHYHRTRRLDHSVVRRERLELVVWRRLEGQPRLVGDTARDLDIIPLDGVEAGPDRGAAQRQLAEVGQDGLRASDAVLDLEQPRAACRSPRPPHLHMRRHGPACACGRS